MASVIESRSPMSPPLGNDPRGLDLSFAFGKEEYSDRLLVLEICEEGKLGLRSISGGEQDKGQQEKLAFRKKEVHVMSAILVAQSEFFKSLFSPEWQSKGANSPVTIRLTPDEEEPFMALLRYMYTGHINPVTPEGLLGLLMMGNKYGVLSCINVCAHHLREVPLHLSFACMLLQVLSGMPLADAATYLLELSTLFLVNYFSNLDSSWRTAEFLSLPGEAVEAILGSDEVCAESEGTIFTALLQWTRRHFPGDAPEALAQRRERVGRLARAVRFPLMETDVLRELVRAAPEADSPAVRALVEEALWFKSSSFEQQQLLVAHAQGKHRRYQRRKQLSIYSEVLLQDCQLLQGGQSILLTGGAWVDGKMFSLKVMKVAVSATTSEFGLYLQVSQRSPQMDKVLDDSVTADFSFKVKEWPEGMYVQQRSPASHTFKGTLRERGYRNLLHPWNDVVRDNSRYFRNGVMALRADLRIITPGELQSPYD